MKEHFCAPGIYSMVSIERPVLLNVLVWIFPPKTLWNDLVYLKFWQTYYMEIKEIKIFFEKVSIKQPVLSFFQILEA